MDVLNGIAVIVAALFLIDMIITGLLGRHPLTWKRWRDML